MPCMARCRGQCAVIVLVLVFVCSCVRGIAAASAYGSGVVLGGPVVTWDGKKLQHEILHKDKNARQVIFL